MHIVSKGMKNMFNIDRKYLYIILGILVVFSLANYINNPTELLTLLLTLPGVIIAITFHEFAHAWTAYKLGDNTPKMQGRVNLNPLSHIDPFGFAMLVFVHIGWGKPVEINLIIAIILTVISFCLLKFAPAFVLFNRVGTIISTMLEMAIVVNIGLGIFNLVPLPPLDGSKILMHFLPYNARNWFVSNQNIFYIVFLVIWITGAVGYIISPIINAVYIGLYSAIGWIFGLF